MAVGGVIAGLLIIGYFIYLCYWLYQVESTFDKCEDKNTMSSGERLSGMIMTILVNAVGVLVGGLCIFAD